MNLERNWDHHNDCQTLPSTCSVSSFDQRVCRAGRTARTRTSTAQPLAATKPLRSSASSAVRNFTAEAAEVRRKSCQKNKKLRFCYTERRRPAVVARRTNASTSTRSGRPGARYPRPVNLTSELAGRPNERLCNHRSQAQRGLWPYGAGLPGLLADLARKGVLSKCPPFGAEGFSLDLSSCQCLPARRPRRRGPELLHTRARVASRLPRGAG